MKTAPEIVAEVAQVQPGLPGSRIGVVLRSGESAATVFNDEADFQKHLQVQIANGAVPLGIFVLEDGRYGRHLFSDFEEDQNAWEMMNETIISIIGPLEGRCLGDLIEH